MKTGKHNPNFALDYQKTTWSDKQHEDYLTEINKKDFFSLLKTYSHLSNWDEEVMTEMIVSDNLGGDIVINFFPKFNVTNSINHLTGVPETDNGGTFIEIWDIKYTKSYIDDAVLELEDFDKTEIEKIKSIILNFCE
ncbi:MAG: hypothetical protein JXQ96_23650 [Cyclobacteriaceae bacterium]